MQGEDSFESFERIKATDIGGDAFRAPQEADLDDVDESGGEEGESEQGHHHAGEAEERHVPFADGPVEVGVQDGLAAETRF